MSDVMRLEKKKARERKYYHAHKEIFRGRNHDYYLRHREDHLAKCAEWARQNKVNGITVKGKRAYPKDDACELCGKKGKRLGYHHWDDDNLHLGIWCCMRCHRMCHTVDGWDLDVKVVAAYKKLRGQLCQM
jgi:hypothetical protein